MPYAEHAFPGKSVLDLAGVRTVSSGFVGMPGYLHYAGGALVRDGFAAITCNSSDASVVFFEP